MKYHNGKTFLSPSRLIRYEKALYFPNLHGYTLTNPRELADTTNILRGRLSVVSVCCGKWAGDQTRTFLGDDAFRGPKEQVQRVEVNVEEDWLRAWVVRMSVGGLRRERREWEWGRYLVVRRGMDGRVGEDLGMANGKVGYVYLVDEACKIRWAGCGDAADGEKESLMKAVRKLVEGRKDEAGPEKEWNSGGREKIAIGATG